MSYYKRYHHPRNNNNNNNNNANDDTTATSGSTASTTATTFAYTKKKNHHHHHHNHRDYDPNHKKKSHYYHTKTSSTAATSATAAAAAAAAPPPPPKKRSKTPFSEKQQPIQQQPQIPKQQHPIIFCDMDGVLVDFNGGISKVSGGIPANELPIRQLWQLVGQDKYFFEHLDWTHDGQDLWKAIEPYRPILLTGVPNSHTASIGRQKANWCRREFYKLSLNVNATAGGAGAGGAGASGNGGSSRGSGSGGSGNRNNNNYKKKHNNYNRNHNSTYKINHIDKAAHKPQRHEVVNNRSFRPGMINVISCWSKFKHLECIHPKSILIDDRIKLRQAWEAAGGIFVHHVTTQQTLAILEELGVLNDTKHDNNINTDSNDNTDSNSNDAKMESANDVDINKSNNGNDNNHNENEKGQQHAESIQTSTMDVTPAAASQDEKKDGEEEMKDTKIGINSKV